MSGALVLIVEDDEQMRLFLRMSLTAKGFRPLEAVTAQEALTMARTHNPEIPSS
jgi:DNA-binding response OmpR family regulator